MYSRFYVCDDQVGQGIYEAKTFLPSAKGNTVAIIFYYSDRIYTFYAARSFTNLYITSRGYTIRSTIFLDRFSNLEEYLFVKNHLVHKKPIFIHLSPDNSFLYFNNQVYKLEHDLRMKSYRIFDKNVVDLQVNVYLRSILDLGDKLKLKKIEFKIALLKKR